MSSAVARGAELDAADPLAAFREEFLPTPGLVAYLDGNSLGRPTRAGARAMGDFAQDAWAARLIRGWDESWFELPLALGDRLAATTLGAAPGQTFIGDSTTVILYKLMCAALDARADRREVIIDTGNFPTDRFLISGLAAQRGLTLRWIEPPLDGGVELADVEALLGDQTALVVLSQIAYRSGHLGEVAPITAAAHAAGALVLWDLCHSVGAVPIELDAWGVDLAAGCTYKYLGGGPGSPAFGYVRAELQADLRQPVQGWMGARDVFAMGADFEADPGIRGFVSGTPPITAMQPMVGMLELIERAGIEAIREKSIALTGYAEELVDEQLIPLGARFASPRDPGRRGSHITVDHPEFAAILPELWERGIIPDFRHPDGLRLGLSPLSTSFEEIALGVQGIAEALRGRA